MATRPTRVLNNSAIETRTVKAASAVTVNLAVKFDGEDVLNAGSGERANAIALETGAAGVEVQIYNLNGGGTVPVLVGTGGATAGAFATVVADGLTDITFGGGTTVKYAVGVFDQTGVAGDIVGLKVSQVVGVTA